MNRAALKALLAQDEGLRTRVYDDATGLPIRPGTLVVGHPTIGIGRALDVNGINEAEARYLCENDIARCEAALDSNAAWWRELSEARQQVMCSLVFNMGWGGVSKFVKFLAAMKREDWPGAAMELKDSHWYEQVKSRGERLAVMIEKG